MLWEYEKRLVFPIRHDILALNEHQAKLVLAGQRDKIKLPPAQGWMDF